MMFSSNLRFTAIGTIVALAACGAKVDAPLVSSAASAPMTSSAMRPKNWLNTWTFYVKNKTDVRIRQLVRSETCMDHIPQERLFEPGHEYTQELETSGDPSCALDDSSVKFDYYTKEEVGWGSVKWVKPFLGDYAITTIDQNKLCFSTQSRGVGRLQLNIRRC